MDMQLLSFSYHGKRIPSRHCLCPKGAKELTRWRTALALAADTAWAGLFAHDMKSRRSKGLAMRRL
jgi:hypothetical protein